MSSAISEPPILVNEKEAARMLGCCERTVYRMRKAGELKYVSLGAAIRYSRDEIARFVESRSTVAK